MQLDFHLLVRAKDLDDGRNDDDDNFVDDVLINMMLEANASYTAVAECTGMLGI